MASRRDTGRPVQIVRIEGGKGCSLDDNALKRILLDDNIKDLPVVVVSVAGIFRKGKSFLLNFFLQYMRSRGQGDWMVNNVPSEGFRWRGGSDTETLGIWIWDEVFVTNTGGKKVAVIFLDTQGTFDTKTTVNNCATIFALSMMTSSVQIYNLSQNIGEDHLQHLQLFTQYGKLAQQVTEKRPFQKLLFLVRDWQYGYERAYGFDGGYDLLEQRLKVSEELDPELQSLRHDIESCFSEISCFLLPHPGKKVASGPQFEGCLSDIDDEFKEQLQVLVPFVLQPNNLVVKKISNSDVTCRQMLDYFVVGTRATLVPPSPCPCHYRSTPKSSTETIYRMRNVSLSGAQKKCVCTQRSGEVNWMFICEARALLPAVLPFRCRATFHTVAFRLPRWLTDFIYWRIWLVIYRFQSFIEQRVALRRFPRLLADCLPGGSARFCVAEPLLLIGEMTLHKLVHRI
ncbi:hypothetical protein HPB48_018864 [Haemaphysalis longicornis]|uniref:GB1/RHD3-type G domain-containing protein n=1 Tax=Haemaphysalis longicornis TaxID=44386 RepID=A0A9J6FZA0_HAELO|nr:hypothetical protein HPB48_018864 [Haemaphysalis longicornis]